MDLAAIDHLLDLLAPEPRRARRAPADLNAAFGELEAHEAARHQRVRPDPRLVEPRPLSIEAPPVLLSLPPPSQVRVDVVQSLVSVDGLREPSIAPSSLPEPASMTPPQLSLTPLSMLPPVETAVIPRAAPLPQVGAEALELDLSVLGPSELPPDLERSGAHEIAPEGEDVLEEVDELEVLELDEGRISTEPTEPRRVAPPLPPLLRRAR